MPIIGGLVQRDIDAVTEVSGALAPVHDLTTLRAAVPVLVKHLVPSTRSVWNELDLVRGRNHIVSSDPIETWPTAGADLVRNLGQHPVFCHYQATGDGEPHAISEYTSPDRFRRSDLYNEVYRRIGLGDQLSTTLFDEDLRIQLTIDRDGWGFAERDRVVLRMLRPLLMAKCAALRSEARLARLLEAREVAAAPVTEGVLVVSPPDRVVDASPAALSIVDRWYPGTTAVLPPPFAGWYAARRRGARSPRPFLVVDHPVKGRLTARLVRDRDDVIVVRERRAQTVTELGERWGLSPRQTAVIELAVAGRPNVEIAGKLGISTRTVEKHLEQVYERLGVAGRSAAAALIGQLDPGEPIGEQPG